MLCYYNVVVASDGYRIPAAKTMKKVCPNQTAEVIFTVVIQKVL